MWFSVVLVKFHWFGINWHVFNQSVYRNCCLYIIIQKIAPQAKFGKYYQIWFFPRFGGKNGGVLSMRMQVILDSSFARPGSVPIWGGKKGEFRDWTRISQVEVYKRVGKSVIRYLKGPLITIFRRDAPYGCISLFIKPYMEMRYVKGCLFKIKGI